MLLQDQVHCDMDPMRPPHPRYTQARPILSHQAAPAPYLLRFLVAIEKQALATREG